MEQEPDIFDRIAAQASAPLLIDAQTMARLRLAALASSSKFHRQDMAACWRRGWGRGACGARDGVPPVGAVVREKVDATE